MKKHILRFKTFYWQKHFLLFLLCMSQVVTFGEINKKSFTVNGPDNVCGRSTVDYSINYSVARVVRWEIEGGEIVGIGGLGIPEFYQEHFSSEELPDGPLVKFEFNTLGEGEATFIIDGAESSFELGAEVLYSLLSNPANTITVDWTPSYQYNGGLGLNQGAVTAHGAGLGEFGIDGSGVYTKTTTFISSPSVSLAQPTNLNLTCNQSAQLNLNSYHGASMQWSTAGAVIPTGGNWGNGIYIDHFNTVGNVPITVSVSNVCGVATSKVIFNITPPDYGEVQQNGVNVTGLNASVVKPDCQGNFYLGIPKWVSNSCVYTWTLPYEYNVQTNTYSTKTIVGANISGQLPANGLTDFVGKVTITGLCGTPVVKTFIVRAAARPTVDPDFYSCSNAIKLQINNPNSNGPINSAWVSSSPSGTWGNCTNFTTSTFDFTASAAGAYQVQISFNDANNCPVQLSTIVHIQSASPNTPNRNIGWQSGVLSDNRMRVGSNIVAYNNAVYFEGRDGKFYYYTFDSGVQKWIINQIPGIINAAIPAGSTFNKIGITNLNGVDYLVYTDNTGILRKLNLATNVVDFAIGGNTKATDFLLTTNEIYAINTITNMVESNVNLSFPLQNAALKTLISGRGIVYLQNNNLYSSSLGQLTFSNDVYASSDVVYQNGYLYYARGAKGSANLCRININNNPAVVEAITTTANLSGVFTLNLATGVIYYGVLNSGVINTTLTAASGTYKSANIYQAHLQSSVWITNPATTVKPLEGLDMFINSPIYIGNHVFYVGAGHNDAVRTSYELEVWNLYFENACAPALQRVAANAIVQDEAQFAEAAVYPNPFSTELYLDLSACIDNEGNATPVLIEVIDMAGKTIYTSTVLSELNNLQTAQWATGMYIIKITHNNILTSKKIVKIN
jgi:hypothetical protein